MCNVFLVLSDHKTPAKRHSVRHAVLLPHARGRWWSQGLRCRGLRIIELVVASYSKQLASQVQLSNYFFILFSLIFKMEDYVSKLREFSKLDFQSKQEIIIKGRPTPELGMLQTTGHKSRSFQTFKTEERKGTLLQTSYRFFSFRRSGAWTSFISKGKTIITFFMCFFLCYSLYMEKKCWNEILNKTR